MRTILILCAWALGSVSLPAQQVDRFLTEKSAARYELVVVEQIVADDEFVTFNILSPLDLPDSAKLIKEQNKDGVWETKLYFPFVMPNEDVILAITVRKLEDKRQLVRPKRVVIKLDGKDEDPPDDDSKDDDPKDDKPSGLAGKLYDALGPNVPKADLELFRDITDLWLTKEGAQTTDKGIDFVKQVYTDLKAKIFAKNPSTWRSIAEKIQAVYASQTSAVHADYVKLISETLKAVEARLK